MRPEAVSILSRSVDSFADNETGVTWFFNFGSTSDPCPDRPPVSPSVNASEFQNNAALRGIHPASCDPDADTNDELYTPFVCAVSQAIANGTDPPELPNNSTPEWVQKTFHPRSPGHAATKSYVLEKFAYNSATATSNKVLRIMCVGDNLTVGLGGSNGGTASYRMQLYQLLNNNGNQVSFVGTAPQGGNVPWAPSESYLTSLGNVASLTSTLQKNKAVKNMKPNLVLVMAGTQDFMANTVQNEGGVDRLTALLEALIDEIHDQNQDKTILLAQIPPVG